MMTLEKMEEHLKKELNSKRRLELEAKLYGYWYPEMNNENLVFEAKSDNEVLAQLNMLEKRLNDEREKNENQAKLHDLKMQQELSLLDRIQLDRQQLREREIREIRTSQEAHMHQLKGRQPEIDTLRQMENKLKNNLEELNKEFKLLLRSYDVLKKSYNFGDNNDIESIKVLINQRSEVYRSQIKMCMTILERTLEFAERPDDIRNLIVSLEADLEVDTNAPSKIDAMSASEAKAFLQHSEEAWHVKHDKCCRKIKDILSNERDSLESTLGEIMKRQENMCKMRTTHLIALDNSGEKVKQLLQEDEEHSPNLHTETETQEGEDHKKSVTFTRRHSHQQGKKSNDSALKASANKHVAHSEERRHSQQQSEDSNESSFNLSSDKHEATHENAHQVSEEKSQLHSVDGEEHKQSFISSRRHSHQQGEESSDFPLYSSCNSHEAINAKHAEGRRHPHQLGEESADFPLYSSCNRHEAIKTGTLMEERHYSPQQEESNDSSLNAHRHEDIKNDIHLQERHHSEQQESQDSSLNSSSVKNETLVEERRHSQQQGDESNDSSLNTHSHEDIKNQTHLEERQHSQQQGKDSQDSSLKSSSIKTETHSQERRHSQHQGEESNDSSLKLLPNIHEANDGEGHKQNIRSAPLHPQQVVTEETEANRPRFGRRHSATREETIYSHPNANESHNNLSPRCFNSLDCDDIDQPSNKFNNLNIGDWQHNPHHTKLELDDMRMNDQRELRVVTAETEADRPRFGINHHECLNSQLTATEREELRKLVSLSMRHTHQITEESIDSPFYNAGADNIDDDLDVFKLQGLAVHTNCNK